LVSGSVDCASRGRNWQTKMRATIRLTHRIKTVLRSAWIRAADERPRPLFSEEGFPLSRPATQRPLIVISGFHWPAFRSSRLSCFTPTLVPEPLGCLQLESRNLYTGCQMAAR
jgi:hypothetical protein